jgi:hypothetical protein
MCTRYNHKVNNLLSRYYVKSGTVIQGVTFEQFMDVYESRPYPTIEQVDWDYIIEVN